MPTIQEVIKDPDFHALPEAEKVKVMASIDPEFSSLAPDQQGKVVASLPKVMNGSEVTPPPLHTIARPTLEGLGMVFGGAAGGGSPLPGGAVLGAGLGYAAGKRLADMYEGVSPEQPLDAPGGVVRDTANGMALEMGGQLIGPTLNALIPQQASRNALALLERAGVKLSPGQIAGGWAKNLEDKLSGVPVLGDAISAARKTARETFNVGAGKRAGYQGSRAGNEMVAEIGDRLGAKYDQLLGQSSADLKDPQFLTNLNGVKQLVASLPKREQNYFDTVINREITPRMTNSGLAGGESLQAMKSGLDRQINHFKQSSDGYQRQLGEALQEVRTNLHDLIVRSNPDLAGEYNELNRQYANYKRIESASGGIGADKGVFTPSQLLAAARRGDKSLDKKQFARGEALLQEYAQAGKDILDNRIGTSGTSERQQALNPAAWFAGAALSPIYNNALTRSLARAPAATLNALSGYFPGEVRRMATPFILNQISE